MKRIAIAALALSVIILIVGCQKQEKAPEITQTTTTEQNTETPSPQGPPMRPSDARIAVQSVTASPGQSGSFKIEYYGVEPAKALVVPLHTPDGMYVP